MHVDCSRRTRGHKLALISTAMLLGTGLGSLYRCPQTAARGDRFIREQHRPVRVYSESGGNWTKIGDTIKAKLGATVRGLCVNVLGRNPRGDWRFDERR